MKRLLASLALIVAAATLSGCYYDPGYSYVRSSGYGGDAYYGRGGSDYVVPGYYDGYYGSGYYNGGYGYAPGVSVWYSGSRYRHDGYRGHRDHRDYGGHEGHWQGRGDAGGRNRARGGDYRGHEGHGGGRPSSGSRSHGDSHGGDRRGRGGDNDRRHHRE